MKTWDQLDYQIIELLQEDFPLTAAPFKDIANQLEITEEEVIDRITRLYEKGIIRRIGGIMNSSALGFYSTLCACGIPENKIMAAASIINSYKQVTHNYIRDHQQYNIWFTITAESRDDVFKLIREIEKRIDAPIVNMPARKVYKIKVAFKLENGK